MNLFYPPIPPPTLPSLLLSPSQIDRFCKLISDFCMEYRTTHGKVLARLERKKFEKERKKTKGKFIVSTAEWGTYNIM